MPVLCWIKFPPPPPSPPPPPPPPPSPPPPPPPPLPPPSPPPPPPSSPLSPLLLLLLLLLLLSSSSPPPPPSHFISILYFNSIASLYFLTTLSVIHDQIAPLSIQFSALPNARVGAARHYIAIIVCSCIVAHTFTQLYWTVQNHPAWIVPTYNSLATIMLDPKVSGTKSQG